MTWCVGGKQPRNVYEDNNFRLVCIGPEDEAARLAARIVHAMNNEGKCPCCGKWPYECWSGDSLMPNPSQGSDCICLDRSRPNIHTRDLCTSGSYMVAFPKPSSPDVAAALALAVDYGGIDGDHHKAWVIDQMVRALAGSDYEALVRNSKAGEDGPDTYSWDEGIPP